MSRSRPKPLPTTAYGLGQLFTRPFVRTISKKTNYGLQALITLARRYGKGPVLIATLAKEEDIPIKFLEGILLDLKNGALSAASGTGL
jgi:DNA-binding IscR family transcriptional regulator